MECDITFEKPVLKDLEEIARLLSSPAFYDENTHQLNFAAFNLRRFTNGEVESYVSLSRLSFIDQSPYKVQNSVFGLHLFYANIFSKVIP